MEKREGEVRMEDYILGVLTILVSGVLGWFCGTMVHDLYRERKSRENVELCKWMLLQEQINKQMAEELMKIKYAKEKKDES